MTRPQNPARPISVSASHVQLRMRTVQFSLTRVSRGAEGRTRNGKMAADGGRATLPCSFSPKSQQFLGLCAQDGRLRIWNTDSKTLQQEYVPSAHLSAACTCATWGPCRAVQVAHSIQGQSGCGLCNAVHHCWGFGSLWLCIYPECDHKIKHWLFRNIYFGCFRAALVARAAHMLHVAHVQTQAARPADPTLNSSLKPVKPLH